MSTNSPALWAGRPVFDPTLAGEEPASWYPDAPVQWRLIVVLAAGLVGVVGSFWIEDMLLPWYARMDATTPGWSFVLSEASVLGCIVALAVRARSAAIVQALLAATLVGYTYVFAGAALIDPRRSVQSAHLIFRAVELGLVSVAAMIVGSCLRLLLRQRLALAAGERRDAAPQYGVGDLMFLTVVFAMGMWLVNLFFDHFDRNAQLTDVVLAVVRALPAALPWLWGLTQPRLSPGAILAIIATSLLVWAVKAGLEYHGSGEELWLVIYQTGVRAAAFASGASFSGLLLRGLGFRWCAE